MPAINLEDSLRKAVNDHPCRFKLAKEAEVPYSRVHGFSNGRGLSLKNAQKLCDVLGFKVVVPRSKKRAKR